ncbi:MAG: PHP domain-containing protein [Ruminococcaceae bacterium]|nr:PHP domain-containing protein [Oscillospiraceae bacterium]
MNRILYDFDIYPKVFLGDREQTVNIQPLGAQASFTEGKSYTIKVLKVNQSIPSVYPERSGRSILEAIPDEDGYIRFTAFFEGEGEHYIFIFENPEDKKPKYQLSVYSLNEDMEGKLPFRGDLHIHTSRSDGKEAPAVVAANYRGHGYDFFTISDHRRFYPSLEAIEAFGDITDFKIVQGEEIHLPMNHVHYVNFGSTFSINALVTPNDNQEKGDDLKYRSINGEAPDVMTREEFEAMIIERAKTVDRPYESERRSFAVLEWTYEQVQKGGGLGIFPHPYWLCPTMQLAEDYTEYVYKKAPFDAFEVLGGENIFSHNGFQTGLYYEMREKGFDPPIVGSTDSHGSTEHNRNALICSTIVFAEKNDTRELIDAIKSKYSVAVDTISAEYRIVGDFRLMKYACFLMENYFPLHDLACKAEGYYMNRYIAGDKRAEAILRAMKGQIAEMQEKYFSL